VQNEALISAGKEVENAHEKYADLYDFAPVGYLTFDEKGIIRQLNLTATRLLGFERSVIVGKPFAVFVKHELQDVFYHYLRETRSSEATRRCELILKRKDGALFHAQLDSLALKGTDDGLIHSTLTDISERRIIEERLLESERQLKLALSVSHTGMWSWDAVTDEVFWSPESYEIIGSREMSPTFGSFVSALHPEDAPRVLEAIRQVSIDRPDFSAEFRFIRHDGTVRWIANSGRGSFDGAGVILGMVGSVEDITERKQTEHRQHLSNKIMNLLNDPSVLADSLNLILAAIQREIGFDAVGIRLRNGDDYPYFVQNGFSHDFLLAENSLTVRARDGGLCRDKDGSYSLECTCGLIISGKVEPTNPLFTPWGSWWTNNSFPILDLPPSEDLRLYPRNRCIHENFASVALIPIRADREIIGLLQLNDRKKDRFTLDMIHFFEGIGISIGVALMRKQAEEELKRAHELLEQRVIERTAELEKANEKVRLETEGRKQTEAVLYQAQKMEAIGTLAGGIAHDFNNILGSVIGFSEMIEEDAAPGSSERRRAEQIRKAGFRGRDLVKQILTFSRQTSREKEVVVLKEIIEEVLKLLRPILPSTIVITTQIRTKESVTLADSVQMHQILMNLCTNAAHAMVERGGLLEVSLEDACFSPGDPVPDPCMIAADYLRLSVRDTGYGMEEGTLKQIFDPFFTTKAPGEGTGLGLSVVHGIVRDHGGCIAVDSKPGRGSTFHVYLPKLEASVVAEIEGAVVTPRGSEHILFVDDEQMSVDLNQERLTSLGYKVVTSVSSKKALDIFSKRPDRFDLLITDYTMPDLNGIDLAKELFNIRPKVPVILCTGNNDVALPERAKEAGIRAFLTKPLTKKVLAQTIRRVLDTNPGKQEGRS
jgi:PAS domain S-box-containing protein